MSNAPFLFNLIKLKQKNKKTNNFMTKFFLVPCLIIKKNKQIKKSFCML